MESYSDLKSKEILMNMLGYMDDPGGPYTKYGEPKDKYCMIPIIRRYLESQKS